MRKKKRDFDIEFQKKYGYKPERKHAEQHCKDKELAYDFSDVDGHNYREIGGQSSKGKVVDPRGKYSRDRKAWREAVRSQKIHIPLLPPTPLSLPFPHTPYIS